MTSLTRTLALTLTLAATVAGAQATTRIPVAPTSKVWIEGTSNVHEWKCDATTIDAVIDAEAATGQVLASPKAVKKVAVKIPVKSLKCGHDKMDDNLYKALDAAKNADISYVLGTFEATPGENKDDFTLKTTGKLTISGVENSIDMSIAATRLADGTIKAVGTVPVKMTAFGVKPPTAMFGAIKCGDEVKVKFELLVGAKVLAAAVEK